MKEQRQNEKNQLRGLINTLKGSISVVLLQHDIS